MIDGNVLSLTLQELQYVFASWGEPGFRAKQVFSWLHQKQCSSFDDMTNIPFSLRQRLQKEYKLFLPQLVDKQVSADGTVKFLFRMFDGQQIETVLMRHSYGSSVCVSTQAGCRMGCRFCASTQGGRIRNLSADEILGQVYAVQKTIDERVGNVVLMGIGEPLDNLEAVLKFIALLTDEQGQNLSARGITLSTCGLVPEINLLAEQKLSITLSVSLHAASDAKRSEIMPVNKRYPINMLISACKDYQKITGRRVSFEYAMVAGFNDTEQDAKALAKLLKNLKSHVNLIPINPVDGKKYRASDEKNILDFQKLLLELGVNATVRRRLGADIEAACGQLRRRAEQEALK